VVDKATKALKKRMKSMILEVYCFCGKFFPLGVGGKTL
jgi:hypothetical protein